MEQNTPARPDVHAPNSERRLLSKHPKSATSR
jgi:hypothetical protein